MVHVSSCVIPGDESSNPCFAPADLSSQLREEAIIALCLLGVYVPHRVCIML
jgi:hypothetical protein